MPFLLKLLATNIVIISCAQLGRRLPTLSGLIAAMPITTVLVLFWLHADDPANYRLLADFSRGVFWGIGPTLLFFAAATLSFRRGLPLPLVISISFACWLAGAAVHQWLVK